MDPHCIGGLHEQDHPSYHIAAADVTEGFVAEADVEVTRKLLVAGARLAEGDHRTQLPYQPGSPGNYDCCCSANCGNKGRRQVSNS